jgi:hypothetical protein
VKIEGDAFIGASIAEINNTTGIYPCGASTACWHFSASHRARRDAPMNLRPGSLKIK